MKKYTKRLRTKNTTMKSNKYGGKFTDHGEEKKQGT